MNKEELRRIYKRRIYENITNLNLKKLKKLSDCSDELYLEGIE